MTAVVRMRTPRGTAWLLDAIWLVHCLGRRPCSYLSDQSDSFLRSPSSRARHCLVSWLWAFLFELQPIRMGFSLHVARSRQDPRPLLIKHSVSATLSGGSVLANSGVSSDRHKRRVEVHFNGARRRSLCRVLSAAAALATHHGK